MKIKDGFLVRELEDSFVVVSINNEANNFNGMIQLNHTGAFIFQMLEQECTKEAVVQAMLEKYELSIEQANIDFDNFVRVLQEADLLL